MVSRAISHAGTSPRMRGKPLRGGVIGDWSGNIPAYAGKTNWILPIRESPAEHPRVCGENGFWQFPKNRPRGTSPRMRGKPTGTKIYAHPPGNIPAYAGKTPGRFRPGDYHEEHPRVCGENEVGKGWSEAITGTSPRMRGKRPVWFRLVRPWRNIPAYAGKTAPPQTPQRSLPEHPRVCGENQ